MIAIDVTMVRADGNPFSYDDLILIINDQYVELIEFFDSCIADSLIINTCTDNVSTTRYYAINTAKATEFQERFMSVTAPFSIQQFWMANGFTITAVTQTQVVFENEPTSLLEDLINVDDNLLWGWMYPILQ